MTSEIAYICPLKIPKGHALMPQRQRRYDNGFPQTLTLDSAVQYLEDELKDIPGAFVTVYSNYDRLNSPRTRAKREDDTAICCEIKYGSRIYYLLCDRWYMTEHNLYALHLSVRAIRNIVKWGVASFEQALAGFDAAYEAGAAPVAASNAKQYLAPESLPEWMKLLGMKPHDTIDDANGSYRRRAKEAANDEEMLVKLNSAIEAARKHFGA